VSNATHFHEKTAPAVKRVLEKCRINHDIVRLQMGDPETGRVWLEEMDVVGFIGRSSGTQKVPLIIEPLLVSKELSDVRSADGGPALLEHHILRIVNVSTGVELYRHPKYEMPHFEVNPNDNDEAYKEGYLWAVYHLPDRKKLESQHVAAFKEYDDALEYVAFVSGLKTHRAFRTYDEWREEQMKEQHED
jgi:hypothetical protein